MYTITTPCIALVMSSSCVFFRRARGRPFLDEMTPDKVPKAGALETRVIMMIPYRRILLLP